MQAAAYIFLYRYSESRAALSGEQTVQSLPGPAGSSFTFSKVWRLRCSLGLCWMHNVNRRPSNVSWPPWWVKYTFQDLGTSWEEGKLQEYISGIFNKLRELLSKKPVGFWWLLQPRTLYGLHRWDYFELKQESIHKEPTYEGISCNIVTSPY